MLGNLTSPKTFLLGDFSVLEPFFLHHTPIFLPEVDWIKYLAYKTFSNISSSVWTVLKDPVPTDTKFVKFQTFVHIYYVMLSGNGLKNMFKFKLCIKDSWRRLNLNLLNHNLLYPPIWAKVKVQDQRLRKRRIRGVAPYWPLEWMHF